MADEDDTKKGGSSTGLIIGGVAVIAVAGVVGWYLYTGWSTEQAYIDAVKKWQDCIETKMDAGRTYEQAKVECEPYQQAVDALQQQMEKGFGYWVDVALKDLQSLGIYAVALGSMFIGYQILKRYMRNHPGSGGGTPTKPFHDNYDNTNWDYETTFQGHCTFDYGTPSYQAIGMSSLWASINAVPDWQKELLAGYLGSQGVSNPLAELNASWNSLPVSQQMILAGLIITGTLLVCTISLGAATPAMLPIAAAAIAMV